MFTGIISDIGTITKADDTIGGRRFCIECSYDMDGVPMGASIACAGICLTVTEKQPAIEGKKGWFMVDASPETLSLTPAKNWKKGDNINLERALKMGDELGGHLVFGHVDGMAELVERTYHGDNLILSFICDASIFSFMAVKGSVTIDGVSLTINNIDKDKRIFTLNIIPHTQKMTTLSSLPLGGQASIEVDGIMRYIARLLEGGMSKDINHIY